MDKEDLREVTDQLDVLDSLGKLFEKIWFTQVKNDITDERVRAYLTVFDDAFPGFNQVVEFVRDSAGAVVDGDIATIQQLFSRFAEGLLNNGSLETIPVPVGSSAPVADEASDIDSLFADDVEIDDAVAEDRFDDAATVAPSEEEFEAILGDTAYKEESRVAANPDELFGDDGEEVAPEDNAEADELVDDDLVEEDLEVEDLEALLESGEDDAVEDENEAEADLEELLGDDDEDVPEEDEDLRELLSVDEGEVDEEEILDITDDEDEEVEADDGDISQDEIDALFEN